MVATAAAATGLLSSIIKLGLNAGVSMGDLMLSSVGISFLCFFVVMLLLRQEGMPLRQFYRLFAIGLVMGLSAFTYTKTVENLPASVAVVLQFQFVWIGVLLDAVYRRTWPPVIRWLMVVLILFGTVLAAGLFNELDGLYLSRTGILFGLLCAICFSCYLFLNAHAAPEIHWSQRSFCIMAGCMAATMLLTLPGYSGQIAGSGWGNVMLYGGLMALFGYAIPVVFFAVGIPRIGSGISSIICACELPVAIIGAMFILGERVSGLQWIGVVIIFASMFIREPAPSDAAVALKEDSTRHT